MLLKLLLPAAIPYDYSAMELLSEVIKVSGLILEMVGAAIIGIGTIGSLLSVVSVKTSARQFGTLRRRVGKAILLGLEFLIAADIIRTVAVSPNLAGLAVLAGIVAIRTFLSFALEVEMAGRWPWQNAESKL